MTEENAHNAQVGTICGMLGMAWVIICVAIMPTPAVACCYDSSPPEYSTPIYDDPQQPDQIVDEAPADEVPDIVGTDPGSKYKPLVFRHLMMTTLRPESRYTLPVLSITSDSFRQRADSLKR